MPRRLTNHPAILTNVVSKQYKHFDKFSLDFTNEDNDRKAFYIK